MDFLFFPFVCVSGCACVRVLKSYVKWIENETFKKIMGDVIVKKQKI